MNVEKALAALGIEEITSRGDERIALCPMHEQRTGKTDHNPSWSINVETGQHLCFSCGYKGGLLSLVTDIRALTKTWGQIEYPDYDAAREWLAAVAETSVEDIVRKLGRDTDYSYALPKPVPMSEARLAVFSEPPQWALDARRLTAHACTTHGVLWDNQLNAWITPIRDPEDYHLLGWQEKGQGNRYFKNRPAGMKKAQTLFGIEQFADIDLTQMILVESPLDVVRLESIGARGGVAAFGATVSVEQVKLLRRADTVVIAMDNPRIDAAGRKASHQILNLCRKYGIEASFFNYDGTDAKDIGDMDADTIWDGLENAKDMIFGERAYL